MKPHLTNNNANYVRLKYIKIRDYKFKENDFHSKDIVDGMPRYVKIKLYLSKNANSKEANDFCVLFQVIDSDYYDNHFCAWAVKEKKKVRTSKLTLLEKCRAIRILVDQPELCSSYRNSGRPQRDLSDSE